MTIIISIILFLIFTFLSAIHFYWGFGGRWGSQAVFPTKNDDTKLKMPGKAPTFIVAFGLIVIGIFTLNQAAVLNFYTPSWLNNFGLWIIAGIFILRAIGEFNYVGFFKKIKHTRFGINDTKYYSPLCLTIGILIIILELNK